MADSTPIASLLQEETLEDMLSRHRAEGVDHCAAFWRKAEILQRYAKDYDQWGDDEQLSSVRWRERADPLQTKRLSVNEIRQVVQGLSGRQIMQRFERSYRPRNSEMQHFGETMSAIDKAFMAATDAEQAESAAFQDGPGIQGVSCVRWEYDTLEDERGKIVISDWPIFQAMWGRDARQLNLKDRSWHRIGWWMSARQVKERWPRKWKDVFNSAGTQSWANFESPEGSSRNPWSGDLGNRPLSDSKPAFYAKRDKSFWVEYEEWREVEVTFKVARPVDETMTYAAAIAASLPGEDLMTVETMTSKQLSEFEASHLAMTNEEVPENYIVPQKRIAFKFAYVIGTTIVETGDIPVGAFTILFMTGFRRPSPTGTRFIGLTENLVQAQKYNNLLLMALYKNLQINPKGVLIYEQGTFKSRKDAIEQFTAAGGVLEVARGKMSSGAKPYEFVSGGGQGHSSMVESLFSFYRESIPRQAGFNAGALGQLGTDLRRISGQVVRQVQDAAIQSNAELFDSYRHYRREGGKLFMAFVRTFWGDRLEELAEIVGEEVAYTTDDETGQKTLAIPPLEMWQDGAWRALDIQEVVPDDNELDELWGVLGGQGVFQTVQVPQSDTGKPLFGSLDLVRILPKIKSGMRESMERRIKQEIQEFQQQQQQAQAAQAPPPGDPGEAEAGQQQPF